MDETFRRLHACDGFLCEFQQVVFAEFCLRQATPAAGFCDDVPESIVEGVLWTKTACPDDDVTPQICERVMREILQTCYRSRSE